MKILEFFLWCLFRPLMLLNQKTNKNTNKNAHTNDKPFSCLKHQISHLFCLMSVAHIQTIFYLPGKLLSFLPPSNRCLFNAFDVRGSNRNSPDQIFPFSKYFLLCFPSPSIFLFFPLCSSPSLGKYCFYFFIRSFPRRKNYFLFFSKCSLPFLSLFSPLRINYFP